MATLNNNNSKVTYNYNNAGPYPITFYFSNNNQIKVTVADENGNTSNLNYTAGQYTISNNNMTLNNNVAANYNNNYSLAIWRDVNVTQETDFINNDSFDAETLEDSLTKLTMICQQLNEKYQRNVYIPITDPAATMQMPPKSDRASKFLGFDSDGEPMASTSGPSATATDFVKTLLDDPDASTFLATLGIDATGNEINQYCDESAKATHVDSTDYTILDDDYYSIIRVTTGASDRTITLPTAADNTGRTIVIFKDDSGIGTVTIEGEGAETVNGVTAYGLQQQYAFVTVYCDGSGWIVLAPKTKPSINSVSGDYTITDIDGVDLLLVTAGASDRTITLPTAADNNNRKITIVKVDTGAGKVTVDGEGSETIDGATTRDIISPYESIILVCDGSNWKTITQSQPVKETSSDYTILDGDGYKTVLVSPPSAGVTGTADTDTADKLIDSSATFQTDGVTSDWIAYNSTDGVVAAISSVDSETQLTLDSDAFPDGNENYELYAPVTITLPTVADNTGRKITIAKVGDNYGTLIIDGEGSEKIHAYGRENTTIEFENEDSSCEIISDGSKWYALHAYAGASLVANTTPVVAEHIFTADNELDYTSDIADSTTVTVSELPSNTVAIWVWLGVRVSDDTTRQFKSKRSSGDTRANDHFFYATNSTTYNRATPFWLPTDGNSFYVVEIRNTCEDFTILGYKTKG